MSEDIHIEWPKFPPFEAWLGTVALYAGITYFWQIVPPSGTTLVVRHAFPTLAAVWSVLYGLGGIAILCGLLRHKPRVEGAGLCLLASGICVSTMATLISAPHAPLVPILILDGGLVVSCLHRLVTLP